MKPSARDLVLSGCVRLTPAIGGHLCPMRARVQLSRVPRQGPRRSGDARPLPGPRCTWRRSAAAPRHCGRPTRRPGSALHRRSARSTPQHAGGRTVGEPAVKRPPQPSATTRACARPGSRCSRPAARPARHPQSLYSPASVQVVEPQAGAAARHELQVVAAEQVAAGLESVRRQPGTSFRRTARSRWASRAAERDHEQATSSHRSSRTGMTTSADRPHRRPSARRIRVRDEEVAGLSGAPSRTTTVRLRSRLTANHRRSGTTLRAPTRWGCLIQAVPERIEQQLAHQLLQGRHP